MGKNHSKNTFSQWDLDRFSNVTGISRTTIERLYQQFVASTGKDNRMDKKEFRRLYKELYESAQMGTTVPAIITEHDLEKLSDRVFKAFDGDGSGKLTFEEFVNAYLLLSRNQPDQAITACDRLNYVLDHNNPTPGLISREHAELIFNNLNKYYTCNDTTKTTTRTIINGESKPLNTTWQQHWTELDDGSGRVPQKKFVEYVTTSDDYKTHIDHALA